MPQVTVWIDINASIDRVWKEAANLAAHGDWMTDVESITFEGDQREGTGTRMRVATKVGPLRTMDLMVVTAWEPKRRIAVEHRGLVTGYGEFVLDPIGGATRFTWGESLRFPWFFGGPIGASLSRPLFAWIWRRNLRAFKTRVEQVLGD